MPRSSYCKPTKRPVSAQTKMRLDALKEHGMTVTSHDGNVIGTFSNSRAVGQARESSGSIKLDADVAENTSRAEIPFEQSESEQSDD